MTLPKHLEKIRDEKADDFANRLDYRSSYQGYVAGFDSACQHLLPHIEKMEIMLDHLKTYDDGLARRSQEQIAKTLESWRKFMEGE